MIQYLHGQSWCDIIAMRDWGQRGVQSTVLYYGDRSFTVAGTTSLLAHSTDNTHVLLPSYYGIVLNIMRPRRLCDLYRLVHCLCSYVFTCYSFNCCPDDLNNFALSRSHGNGNFIACRMLFHPYHMPILTLTLISTYRPTRVGLHIKFMSVLYICR